ncbi:MAG: FAD binding domain-containing protein [Chthoniobacterales bacterium]
MDLNTITEIQRPRSLDEVGEWNAGNAWLAGGTWLFSEPQVATHKLIDIETLKWPSLTATAEGLEIAATCRVIELENFVAPPEWKAAPLLSKCCHSFLASFKIWNEATVGGNIVMSLPAGPMISLTTALEGICTLWPRGGEPRKVPMVEFVTGNHKNVLAPGELIRSIFLPASALKKTHAFRRFTLTHLGRSETLIIGTRSPESDEFVLTITASTLRPMQYRFASMPSAADVKKTIDAIPLDQYLADTHGSPEHRQHLTYYFAEQIRHELSA